MTGLVTTVAGSGGNGSADGVGTMSQLYNPVGIAVDGEGSLLVGDSDNNTIRKITFEK